MQQNMDTIKMESRREIEDLMVALDQYVKDHPKERETKTVQELFHILDVMHMTW